MMDFQIHDYVAWAISLGVVVVFVFLLCWDGYITYKEEERRRMRRAGRTHG